MRIKLDNCILPISSFLDITTPFKLIDKKENIVLNVEETESFKYFKRNYCQLKPGGKAEIYKRVIFIIYKGYTTELTEDFKFIKCYKG